MDTWPVGPGKNSGTGWQSLFRAKLLCSKLYQRAVKTEPVPSSEIVVKSRSVKRNAKNARGLGRDRAAEPVRIFLTACSGISAPDIPSDWSIVTVNIIT